MKPFKKAIGIFADDDSDELRLVRNAFADTIKHATLATKGSKEIEANNLLVLIRQLHEF